MHARVTAILVARNGAGSLTRTLAALDAQTRRPDSLIAVDIASTDGSAGILGASVASQVIATSHVRGFGAAVAQGVYNAPPPESDDEWLWLLGHDNVPEPTALAALLGAVEIAPSVAIAGPKLMRADEPDTIAEYGETLTRFGAAIALVENELDQAQYDTLSDVLAVAAAGMLVRRSVWTALGGFDPGLPSADAGLDLAVRARLAGWRVVGVPSARVASAGPAELFGRSSVRVAALVRIRRAAQLHRRMVYSRAVLLPLHWLLLLPLALLRSMGHLIRKQPGAVGGEIGTAVRTAFSGSIAPARRNLARTRRVGWKAIAPLRMTSAVARERRAGRRDPGLVDTVGGGVLPRDRASFLSGGGIWVMLLAAVIGVVVFLPFLGSSALSGGGLIPLSPDIASLWARVGYGWQDVGGGFVGASDPFVAVLAVLGSLTFWSPSLSIVVLYFLALPLAAAGAWWAATRVSERAWPPAIAALVWAVAPPFLNDLSTGHLGAVLVHILLPWFAFALLAAARSWSASGAAGLLFAAIAASAPSVVPALVLLIVVLTFARPTGAHRTIGVIIPAAFLVTPLVAAQVLRGTPLALLADPGMVVTSSRASGWHLALGSPDASLSGWDAVGRLFGLDAAPGYLVAAALLLPFAVVAIAAVFLPGARRAIPALAVGLLGFVTAVAATHVQLVSTAAHPVTLWPGAGLSLYWLGLTASVAVGLDAFRRGVVLPGLLIAVASVLAVAPLLAAVLVGSSPVRASDGTLLPAYVNAEASGRPRLGTLVLTPTDSGGISARVDRGTGTTLDQLSTLVSTRGSLSAAEAANARLAGNLVSRSGLDVTAIMKRDGIRFVLLRPAADGSAGEVFQRATEALGGNDQLTPIGNTSRGTLWRYEALPLSGLAAEPPSAGLVGTGIRLALAVVFVATLLLAIPTGRGRRRLASRAERDAPASLGEDDDA
ncbi:glycosyltransferase family 2 protein [Galbitalea soli]|uniref:Glycosyltransferase family 2 protein n=1 Tax=Galbitalea soli TaxID=1268042 RepID=A0A7C9TRB1_9MICO|nr:glycosyltransferase family 2 protein [Galbitalea soli]NEM91360.1 glycosyltransferase family 2 protein [Galbitalea soli]NYJ30051.1 GT2 family glycosyltransferase [Galbitalea soli]